MIGMVSQMPQFRFKALEVDIAQDTVRLTHFIWVRKKSQSIVNKFQPSELKEPQSRYDEHEVFSSNGL